LLPSDTVPTPVNLFPQPRRLRRRAWLVAIGLATAGTAMPVAADEPLAAWATPREDYFAPFDFDWKDGNWWATAFGGMVARSELSSILFRASPGLRQTYIAGLAIGREFGAVSDALRLEWEGGVAAAFGREDYLDFRWQVGARWIRFPWNQSVFTTFAVLTGPSIITSISRYEDEYGNGGHFKNGLTLELTLSPPERQDLVVAFRIHHRSSIFGLIPNAGTPSDFLTIGLKQRF
jgi:hypothetical protein